MADIMRVIWVIVTVAVNPYIVSGPPDEIQVQHVGDSMIFSCSAGGSPLPKIAWFQDVRRVFSRTVDDGRD